MKVATITIDHTKVASDLTDFVVAVITNSDAGWDELYAVATEGGGDIRTFKAGGVVELPRENVLFSVVGETGEIHIKYTGTLSSSVDTDIEIHANGSSSDYAVTATYGRNAVWSDYVGSWHLTQDASDSAGNYDGTASNVTFSSSGGSFNGSTSKIDLPTVSGVTNVLSMSAYVDTDTTSGDKTILFTANAANNRNFDTMIDENLSRAGWWNGSAFKAVITGTFGTTAKHFAAVRNSTDINVYAAGSDVGSVRTDLGTDNIGLDRWAIGYIRTTTSAYFDGTLKWVRARADVTSANRIATEWKNLSDNAAYWVATDVSTPAPTGTQMMQGAGLLM